jgi:hypothetical protein
VTVTRTVAGIGDVELEIRPRRIRWVAWPVAVFLVVFFAAGAALVHVGTSGFQFRASDQIAMVIIGLLCAGAVLLLTRPRLRAGTQGVQVRSSVLTKTLPWSDVEAVSFPDGAQFARLELPDDEYVTVAALQAVDREHAARGISALRALHARYR